MPRRRRPVNDVEYTGLVDTTTGYSGSSTLDSSVDPGSPLPLVMQGNRNAGINSPHNQFYLSTYDLWDNPDPYGSLKLSGVSDPPFASARQSTPYPLAQEPGDVIGSAFSGLAKFGNGMATLLGNHPTLQAPSPSQLSGENAHIAVQPNQPTSSEFGVATTVIVVLIVLLLINGGE